MAGDADEWWGARAQGGPGPGRAGRAVVTCCAECPRAASRIEDIRWRQLQTRNAASVNCRQQMRLASTADNKGNGTTMLHTQQVFGFSARLPPSRCSCSCSNQACCTASTFSHVYSALSPPSQSVPLHPCCCSLLLLLMVLQPSAAAAQAREGFDMRSHGTALMRPSAAAA